MPTQKEFLSNLLSKNKEATIIGSLGTICYDLTDMEHPDKILVRGAMGAVMGIGLGYALAKPERKVIVVVGDGAFAMKAGAMATLGKYNPPNLEIHVMDNGVHQSTGGQPTNFKHFFIKTFKLNVHEISN